MFVHSAPKTRQNKFLPKQQRSTGLRNGDAVCWGEKWIYTNTGGRPERNDRLRARSLLPERTVMLLEFGWELKSIQHAIHTWPQVIFTCSQRWKHVWVCKRFESFEEVEDAVQQWLNGLATVV